MTATQSECIVWKCKLRISIASLTVRGVVSDPIFSEWKSLGLELTIPMMYHTWVQVTYERAWPMCHLTWSNVCTFSVLYTLCSDKFFNVKK